MFAAVWGLEATPDGGLAMPENSAAENPLLAVMLARLKEGCRLLTDVGELDWRMLASFRTCLVEGHDPLSPLEQARAAPCTLCMFWIHANSATSTTVQ